jgi:hypothetical protein
MAVWWHRNGGRGEKIEEKRDGNTEFTEIGTQRSQREARKREEV